MTCTAGISPPERVQLGIRRTLRQVARCHRSFIVVVASILSFAGPAAAQGAGLSVSPGVAVGVDRPVGRLATTVRSGKTARLSLELASRWTPLRLRVEGTYSEFENRDVGITHDVAAGLDFVMPAHQARLSPYMIAGIGVRHLAGNVREVNSGPVLIETFAGRKPETGTDLHIGAGLAARFHAFTLFLEGRYGVVVGTREEYRDIPVTLGIRF